MDIEGMLNREEDDITDEQLHAIIMGDRSLDTTTLKNEVHSLKERYSHETFYRLWDAVKARVKLGLAYYRLAHVDRQPKRFQKAFNAFKYAWDTDYRYSECGRSVLTRLIESCKNHLQVNVSKRLSTRKI